MLLDGNAEPTYLPLSLLEDITNCFSDAQQIGSGGFEVVYYLDKYITGGWHLDESVGGITWMGDTDGASKSMH